MTNVRLFAEMIYGMVVHSQVPKRETIDLISEQIAKYFPDAEPVRDSYKLPEPKTCETCSPQSADVETVRKKIELAIKFGLPIDARMALKEALAALDRIAGVLR